MVKLWVALIKAGRRTIDQCPESLRELVELELKEA